MRFLRGRRRAALLVIEVLAWTAGIVLLVYVGAQALDRRRGSAEALERFAELKATAPSPDRTQWSPQRTIAWERTLGVPGEAPLAVLRIPGIRLEVPVFRGTGDVALNRGVGHIDETAVPGTSGNSGIAGHRDGFFRGLKDVTAGDTFELDTPRETQVYRIVRTWIVTPDDVSVLDATAEQSITLVTCYPFYFVGSAPQRYIVRAVRVHAPDVHSAERMNGRLNVDARALRRSPG